MSQNFSYTLVQTWVFNVIPFTVCMKVFKLSEIRSSASFAEELKTIYSYQLNLNITV